MAARQQGCGICMESCKNPKLISCHHSFCCKCLEDYVRINLRKGRFDCPICRTNVELPKGGVRCFETKSHTHTNCDEKFACDLCGPKSVACSRCLDCEENLCQPCCYVHEKLKVSRHHKVRDLGTLDFAMKGKIRQRTFCDQHPEEEIKLICRDCNILICVICKAVDHENHATKTVVDAAAEMKKRLQTKMTSCSDKLRNISASKEKAEQLERSIDDAEREELKSVEDQRSHLNQLLGQEVAKVKATIKNVYLSLRQQNATLKRDIQDELRSCSDVFENAQKLTQQGPDIEIIKKGPALDQLISEAISKTDQMPNIHMKNKLFSPAEINQSELIALIGKMQDSTDSVNVDGLLSKPSSSPPIQFEGQQDLWTYIPHTRGQTPPQYYIGTQEADPQGTQFPGISFQTPFQFSTLQSQFVPPFGYASAHDLNKQAYSAPHMPVGGNPSQAAMYQNSTGVRQEPYYNQTSMRPSTYQMSQPQPSQGLYTQQQVMFMPPPQYSGATQQVIKPMLTKVGKSASDSPTTSKAIIQIEESLKDLIQQKGCSNEEVFEWIEEHVDKHTTKQGHFIRVLMTAVCKSAVTCEDLKSRSKVDKSQMKKRKTLLQKYMDHQANLELQALFALQALVHKLENPPGVLRELFDILYDEDIISEDAFIQWEKSEDPQEQEGKSVAMKQVAQFFTWLKNDSED
ncbi:hypothetical protein CHS0354_013235 [Potamilus streckersoni]|uniref:Uncharacterized protein n=1 Tax=Potamilus streckersoni TaxID=2493646 RepID=A0AAE0T2V0_9BIVA|nr:hypothetical protein CHS0354_013235 [Potamilus streckersoni]